MRKDTQGDLPKIVSIQKIKDESRTIRTFVLEAAVSEARPGQFIMLWLPGLDEKPMSIAHSDPLTVTVDRVGAFTTALHTCQEGDTVGWRGPYGHGFSLHRDRPALLVSGGCGVGPMYFLAETAIDQGIPTTVALGARTGLDLPYVARFEALDVTLHVATDDGSVGHKGFVTELVRQEIEDADETPPAIYACGPEPMLVAVHRLCRAHGVPGQLNVERYMKCGFGICGQCALDDLLVCQDGPVFEARRLDGVRDFGRFRRSATGRQLPVR
jgi:dihydroorotate dehydrogenase electron transfer subunit